MAEQHNTSTGHAPAGEHKGAFPPFQSETYASQLVWLVLAFVLLFVLMSKWALPRVGNILDARQKRIDGDIAEAGALKAQSDEAVAAYEKALADARANAQAIANETRDKQAAAAEALSHAPRPRGAAPGPQRRQAGQRRRLRRVHLPQAPPRGC